MPIESGEVIEASILAVKKGIKGNPGELRGLFMDFQTYLELFLR